MQLPPIVDDLPETIHDDEDRGIFFFESKCFLNGNFSVVYLKKGFRQKNKQYIDILNRMRDGQVTDADLTIINEKWGKKVSKHSAHTVAKALAKLFDRERHPNNKNNKNLYSKMRSRWGSHLWNSHVNELRSRPIDEQTADAAITEFERERLQHSEKLADSLDYNFVISVENKEMDEITEEYAETREGMILIEAIDKIDSAVATSPNAVLTSSMRSLLLTETKLQPILRLGIGMKVLFTSNDVGPFVSNNSMATITEFRYGIDNALESILLCPCTPPGIVPEPLLLTRKDRTIDFANGTRDLYSLTRSQFPIRPGDCGNAYTTQGLTICTPIIFNGQRIGSKHSTQKSFAQVYVAASRVPDESLFFSLHPLRKVDISAHPTAFMFDRYHRFAKSHISVVDYKTIRDMMYKSERRRSQL